MDRIKNKSRTKDRTTVSNSAIDVGRQECLPACAANCLPVRVRTQTGAAGRPHPHNGFLIVSTLR